MSVSFFFLGLPFCTPLVYSLGALCLFLIYILLFADQKKNCKNFISFTVLDFVREEVFYMIVGSIMT